jgi:hypothetical protein
MGSVSQALCAQTERLVHLRIQNHHLELAKVGGHLAGRVIDRVRIFSRPRTHLRQEGGQPPAQLPLGWLIQDLSRLRRSHQILRRTSAKEGDRPRKSRSKRRVRPQRCCQTLSQLRYHQPAVGGPQRESSRQNLMLAQPRRLSSGSGLRTKSRCLHPYLRQSSLPCRIQLVPTRPWSAFPKTLPRPHSFY